MTIHLKGTKQLDREVSTKLSSARVWAVLLDARLLPQWAGVVDRLESCDVGGEKVGSVRDCHVRLGGRTGRIVERCVDMIPGQAIVYAVDQDSFGMSRMFEHYSFRISTVTDSDGTTRVRSETFYTPRSRFAAVVNRLVLRRRFRRVVDELLHGLVRFAADDASRMSGHSDSATPS